MSSAIFEVMDIYLIENYRKRFPPLRGRELTDALLEEIFAGRGLGRVKILRTEAGKPYLAEWELDPRGTDRRAGEEKEPGLHFSVSHSGDLFACGVGCAELGLDIQQGRDLDYLRLSRRHFSEEEQELVAGEGKDAFFRLWTRKEALGKYLGRGMADFLDRVPVIGREDVDFIDLELGENLWGSVCTGAKTLSEEERNQYEISISRRE